MAAIAVALVSAVVGVVGGVGVSAAGVSPSPLVPSPPTAVVSASADRPAAPVEAHLASPSSPLATARFDVALFDPTRATPWRGTMPAHAGRSLATTVVYPTAPGPWPVVGFAHGFDTVPDDYLPLLDRLASAGYVVVAPTFPIGGHRSDAAARRDDLPEQPADVSYALTWAVGAGGDPGSPLHGRVDGARLGAVGHSDGGITVAAMAENTATLDPRLRGTAVLAGGTWPIPGGTWGAVNPGALLVVHGLDDAIAPWWEGRQTYDLAGPPRAFTSIAGGTHWSSYVDGAEAPAVQAQLVAFLDATVRGDVTGRARLATTTWPLYLETDGITADPFGNLESTRDAATGATVLRGWAADPDAPAGGIGVHVYVDGTFAGAGVADQPRPDVAAAFPELGSALGYAVPLPGVADGTHQVCVYGIDVGAGENVAVGCSTIQVRHQPFGNLEEVVVAGIGGGGTVTLTGWSVDPDVPGAALGVHVYVDGVGAAVANADLDRPDVAAAVPGAGAAHGFRVVVTPTGDRPQQICAYALNAGPGVANTTLGCRTVTVPRTPFGSLDLASASGPTPEGAVQVRGWAVDPDTTASLTVHVYVDGVGVAILPASLDRPDVAAAVPGAGAAHGFAGTVAVPGHGSHQVCAYALGVGPGGNGTLGCRTVVVDRTAFGALDGVAVVGAGGAAEARVTGWAIDPDTAAAAAVHVYVDGRIVAAVAADRSRPDLAGVFPAYGVAHGYDVTVPIGSGVHQVCAYVIDGGGGRGNATLGCRTVVASL